MVNNKGLNVTPPTLDDEPLWRQLYCGYADFYNMPMTDEILKTLWSWIHDDHNPFYAIVARNSDGRLLGLMHFRAMPSPLRGAMVGFLDDLFVSPDARGKGVVEALYVALEHQGRKKGWPLIRWITAENNYRARSVYDKLSSKTGWITYQLDI